MHLLLGVWHRHHIPIVVEDDAVDPTHRKRFIQRPHTSQKHNADMPRLYDSFSMRRSTKHATQLDVGSIDIVPH